MMSVLAWCIEGLPFDARSRRAIYETLADWRHEQLAAATPARRVFASVRGALSVVRVATLSLVREAGDFDWCRGLAGRWGLVAALVMLLSFASTSPMLPGLGAETFVLVVLGAPLTLLAILPPALFLVLAWRPVARAAPTTGAVCVAAGATLLLAGWLVPASTGLVVDVLSRSLGDTPGGGAALQALKSAPGPAPSEIVLRVLSWACLAAGAVSFAAAAAKRSAPQSHWWLAGVPAMYAALVASLHLAMGPSFLEFRTVGDDGPRGVGPALVLLTTATLVMVAAMRYAGGGDLRYDTNVE